MYGKCSHLDEGSWILFIYQAKKSKRDLMTTLCELEQPQRRVKTTLDCDEKAQIARLYY